MSKAARVSVSGYAVASGFQVDIDEPPTAPCDYDTGDNDD
jgi:hypothetical protein